MPNLINEANLFVILIALLISFFLLGFILASIIDRPSKKSKSNLEKAQENTVEENPKPSGSHEQGSQINIDEPSSHQAQQFNGYDYRYYNKYW